MQTLVLSRGDVLRHLDALGLLSELRRASVQHATRWPAGPTLARALPRAGASATVRMPGLLEGIPAYSVRVSHDSAEGEQGMLLLHALDTGRLLAVMDAGHLGALCGAVACALAADVLARPDACRVALVGSAPPASVQLKCLRLVRSLSQLRVHDEDHARAFGLAGRLQSTLHLPARSTNTVEEAVEDADLVVVTGSGDAPALQPGMLRPGCHVTVVGLEQPGHRELEGEATRWRVFSGHPGLSGGTALGEVLAGRAPGRTGPEVLTVFRHVGLPLEDLVAAWRVYQGARDDDAVTRLDFSA